MMFKTVDWRFTQCWKQQFVQPQRPCPKRHRYTTSTTEILPQKTQVYYFNHRDPAPKDTGKLLQPQRLCPERHRYTITLCWFHHTEKQATCLSARTETTPWWTDFGHGWISPIIWLTLACSVLLRGWKYSSLGTQNQMSSSQAWHFSCCIGWVDTYIRVVLQIWVPVTTRA